MSNAQALKDDETLHSIELSGDSTEAKLFAATVEAISAKRVILQDLQKQITDRQGKLREMQRQVSDLLSTALGAAGAAHGVELPEDATRFARADDGALVLAWPKTAEELEAKPAPKKKTPRKRGKKAGAK